MLQRRKLNKIEYRLTSGPGSVCAALGIDRKLTGEIVGKSVWMEDRDIIIPKNQIVTTPRIGVDYAGKDAVLPYRFHIKDNPWVTKYTKLTSSIPGTN